MGTDFVVQISTLSKISPQHQSKKREKRKEVASIVVHPVQPEPVSSLNPGTLVRTLDLVMSASSNHESRWGRKKEEKKKEER